VQDRSGDWAMGWALQEQGIFLFSRPVLCLKYKRCVEKQYSETVMHFLFSLLRIKGLYIFRALLANSQEELHKRHLVYCVRVMSVGCTRIEVLHCCTSVVMHGQQNINMWKSFWVWTMHAVVINNSAVLQKDNVFICNHQILHHVAIGLCVPFFVL
jgi:hypothetical protein